MGEVLRRAPLVRAEVALYGPARAAAMLHPRPGRWPAEEPADRLALGVGMAALAASAAPEPRWEPFRAALAGLAAALARAGDGPLPGGLVPLDGLAPGGPLVVVAWEGPGRARVESDLMSSPSGPVPRLRGPGEARGGAAVQVGALALLLALGVDAGGDGRLALGLGVEGLLAWFRESHRAAPPRHALAFALAHCGERMREAGREPPPGI